MRRSDRMVAMDVARGTWFGALVLGLGCAHTPRSPWAGVADARTRELAIELSQARGLRWRQAVLVIDQTGDLFGPELRMLGLTSAESSDVVGLHEAKTGLIRLRAELGRGDERDRILVHELEHALQQQNHPALARFPRDTDAILALEAIVEGDAELGVALWLMQQDGTGIRDRVERLAAVGDLGLDGAGGDWGAFRGRAQSGESGLDWAALLRGASFVASLYLRGGLALVDRALAHPPGSTSAILHPERYPEASPPRQVVIPSLPFRLVAEERFTLGELRLRTTLNQCLPASAARQLASGWAGDQVLRARLPDDSRLLRWVTSFRSVEEAKAFETMAKVAVGCLERAILREVTDSPFSVFNPPLIDPLVARVGSVVNLTAGRLDEGELSRALEVADAESARSDPAPRRSVEAWIDPRSASPWRIEPGGRLSNERLGLHAGLPTGWRVTRQRVNGIELADQSGEAVARIDHLRAFAGDRISQLIHQAAFDAAGEVRGGFHAVPVSSSTFEGGLGLAYEETFQVKERPAIQVRIIAAWACDRQGADVISLTSTGSSTRRALDAFARGVEVEPNRPICAVEPVGSGVAAIPPD